MAKKTSGDFYTEEEKDLLVQHSSDVLVTIDSDGCFKRVSPSFTSMLGWSMEELLSKPYLDFVHPDDREASREVTALFEMGKEAIGFENRYLCKDGTYRWISWDRHSLVDRRLIVAVGRDITRCKEAEEKLRQSEAILARVQEMAHVGHWQRDFVTGQMRWSAETFRMFGYQPQQSDVQWSFLLEHIHMNDRTRVEKGIHDAMKGVRPFNEIFRAIGPEGTVRWVHSRGEVTRNDDGTPRIFGTVLDITFFVADRMGVQ